MSCSNAARTVIVKDDEQQVTAAAAELFKSIVNQAVEQRGICRVALAGGTTPHALYQDLARRAISQDVPWSKVEIFMGDERDVPLDHVESNYNMVQRTLLDHLPVQPTRIHPMRADADDLPAAAEEYECIIRGAFACAPDEIPRFDLILLGMGSDGHTASLFPGSEALEERRRLVVACKIPVLGRWRMTFTYPLINAAHNVILLVTGRDKAEAVEGLMSREGDESDIPAARVRPSDGNLYIVLDADAGRLAGLKPSHGG